MHRAGHRAGHSLLLYQSTLLNSYATAALVNQSTLNVDIMRNGLLHSRLLEHLATIQLRRLKVRYEKASLGFNHAQDM